MRAGEYEVKYGNMPRVGLAAAGVHRAVGGDVLHTVGIDHEEADVAGARLELHPGEAAVGVLTGERLPGRPGRLRRRVVGSDGRPIVGAEVFNRGDAPGPVATATDSQGRFRLAGMLPGTRFVCVRKEGYRFTGAKHRGKADGMAITLLGATEPPPAWEPVAETSIRDTAWPAARSRRYAASASTSGSSGMLTS